MTSFSKVRTYNGYSGQEIEQALQPYNLKYHYAACWWVWHCIDFGKYDTLEVAIKALLEENRLAEMVCTEFGKTSGYYVPWSDEEARFYGIRLPEVIDEYGIRSEVK